MSFKESNSKYENIEIYEKYIHTWSRSTWNIHININLQKFEDLNSRNSTKTLKVLWTSREEYGREEMESIWIWRI